MYWSEREQDIKRADWFIMVVGDDGQEYEYDGSTDSIDDDLFVKEVDEN